MTSPLSWESETITSPGSASSCAPLDSWKPSTSSESSGEKACCGRILIVEDDVLIRRLFEEVLRESGYTELLGIGDPRQVLSVFADFKPDLILLDLGLPYLDGFEVMRQLTSRTPPDSYLPILILTGDLSIEAKERALSMGAKDFVTKPVHPMEVTLRVRNLLETRFLHLRLQHYNQVLEATVRERTARLEETQIEILERLAQTAEYRDDQTGEHTRRVRQLTGFLASALGLPPAESLLVARAAILHDLGKVGIPDSILLKPGGLRADEFDRIKMHTTTGARILSGNRSALLQLAEEIALYHHERWDGKGYAHLQGESIPLAARIVAVADAFDVMTHSRPYREASTIEEAVAEMERESGKQFEPRIVEALLRVLKSQGLLDGKTENGSTTADVSAIARILRCESTGSAGNGEPVYSAHEPSAFRAWPGKASGSPDAVKLERCGGRLRTAG